MTSQGAEKAVIVSATVVGLVYAYRALSEGSSSDSANLKGVIGQTRPVPPLGTWATAWGFTFMVISVIASISPPFGGSFAILIATSDLLSNAPNLLADVNKRTSSTTAPAPKPTVAPKKAPATHAGIAGVA